MTGDRFRFRFRYVWRHNETGQILFTDYNLAKRREDWFQQPANTTRIARLQCTGLKDQNGILIFEGDVFRIEEEDITIYIVITWVQEWCMFASLRIDEYDQYLKKGVVALEEPMFWTYTLEDTNSRKHFRYGNIFQNTNPAGAGDKSMG